MPHSIRTFDRYIGETSTCPPVHDSRSPAEWNFPEFKLVTNFHILTHRSGGRLCDAEIELRRRDLLEVEGITEEVKSGLNRDREPSTSVELVKAHGCFPLLRAYSALTSSRLGISLRQKTIARAAAAFAPQIANHPSVSPISGAIPKMASRTAAFKVMKIMKRP